MNVVGILTELEPFWLGGLTETAQFETLLAWATTCHAAGTALPLPAEFDANRFARFPAAPAPSAPSAPSAANADSRFSPEPVS